MSDLWRSWNCSRCSGEGGLGDLCRSLRRGCCAILDPPDIFHSLLREIQLANPPSWFLISFDELKEWGRLPWTPPASLMSCEYDSAGYPYVPISGGGFDPLSYSLSFPGDLRPGVLWWHRRPSISPRRLELGWGLTAQPDLLEGRWSPAMGLQTWHLGRGPGGRSF